MASEFDKIMRRAGSVSGADRRTYYGDHDVPPSEAAVAKAVKGIQGEVSDQLAWTMEAVRLLIAIKNGVFGIFALIAIIAFRLFVWKG